GPNARDPGLYYVVITTPFGIITNYVATVEVKIPFSLVGLPDRLPDDIFYLQFLELPEIPSRCNQHPISSVGQILLLELCPVTPSPSVIQTPGSTLSGSIASFPIRPLLSLWLGDHHNSHSRRAVAYELSWTVGQP